MPIKYLIQLLFPVRCVLCGDEKKILCDKCVLNLPRRKTPHIKDNLYALFPYNEKMMKEILWTLKYKGMQDLAKTLGNELSSFIKKAIDTENAVLVPIPGSKGGVRKRGFNQSKLLAEEIAKNIPALSVKDVLIRKGGISQHSTKERSKRFKNVQNIFVIKESQTIHGHNIILVDDIITTGATAKEATRVLQKAGAKNVTTIALAH